MYPSGLRIEKRLGWLMTSRRCTILLTVAVLMSLVGCSSGNSSWSAGGGREEIRFHKKRGASFDDCRGAGRGVPTEIHHFVPGLHERDPLRRVVVGIPRFTFTSRAMATSLIMPNRVKSLVNQVPYEDFALV
jgi:hypothetical protein